MQLRLNLLVCDRSVSVNVITHTFVWLKCLTKTKIQILCDHVSHTRLHAVEMGCQMVELLSAHIVEPTMCVNLTLAFVHKCLVMSNDVEYATFKMFLTQMSNYLFVISFQLIRLWLDDNSMFYKTSLT